MLHASYQSCMAVNISAQGHHASQPTPSLRFLKKLSEKRGIPMKDLIRCGKGGEMASKRMYHPEVAIDFARWASPEVAVELSGALMQYCEGGVMTAPSLAKWEVS